MNYVITAAVALLCLAIAFARPRSKREAFELPDGADLLVGAINTNFQCPPNSAGYYADQSNNCQIFHVCNTIEDADGRTETQQFTFLCGNQTVFNQFSLTCSSPEEAIPCESAQEFFYLNDNVRQGDPKVFLHTDQDVERAQPFFETARQYSGQERAAAPRRG